MKRIVLVVTCTLWMLSTAYAEKDHHKKRHHKAHNHGVGKLSLVTSENQLSIEMEIPAHDIVGFENKPTTEAQKSKVKNAIEFLEKTDSNLKLPGNSNCKPDGLGKIETALDEKKYGKKGYHHDHEEHAEFHVTYKFICTNLKKLSFVEVLSFNQFKNIKKLNAQGATDIGQYSQTLTPDSPKFDMTQ